MFSSSSFRYSCTAFTCTGGMTLVKSVIQSRCRHSAVCILCSASSFFICKIFGCYSVCVVGLAKYLRGQVSGAILCGLGLLRQTVRGLIDCTLMVAFLV